jgi:hypothetical protein
MRFHCVAILVLMTALSGLAADLTGTWKVRYSGPKDRGLKTVGSIVLDLKVNGDVVTGMAHIGVWPGDAPIADGKIEGGHITFNATGHLGSSAGIPTCHFVVDVHEGEMDLKMTMTHNPVGPAGSGAVYEFTGGRQTN